MGKSSSSIKNNYFILSLDNIVICLRFYRLNNIFIFASYPLKIHLQEYTLVIIFRSLSTPTIFETIYAKHIYETLCTFTQFICHTEAPFFNWTIFTNGKVYLHLYLVQFTRIFTGVCVCSISYRAHIVLKTHSQNIKW